MLIMLSDKTRLFKIASLHFVAQPFAKAILLPDLNDASSAVESFPVCSSGFPQAFVPASFRGESDKWICRCHSLQILYSFLLVCLLRLSPAVQTTAVQVVNAVASDVHSSHIIFSFLAPEYEFTLLASFSA